MNHIKNKSKIEAKKIVVVGAGKIGRSFIGQLFGCGGYKVVFLDVDANLISLLNQRGSYRVIIKGEKEEEIIVPNVQAISSFDVENAVEAVATAGIMAVSVGKNALAKVLPVIAKGLLKRYGYDQNAPLDIILAENMLSASEYVRETITPFLPSDYPVDKLLGLVETSIGKMVPIMTSADLEKDQLVLFAEAYNTLIVDEKGFKSHIPEIKGLSPKHNVIAWVDRKAFIHNLGHATASYFGYYKHNNAVYMYEVLDDKEVFSFTREVMMQSAKTLHVAYPDDYTMNDLELHVDDLLSRFRNKALKDTVYRVGHDLKRKLGPDDRFMGAIRLAISCGMPYDKIVKAMSYGLCYKAKDEDFNIFPSDNDFLQTVSKDIDSALVKDLLLDPVSDKPIIDKLKNLYKELN